MNNQTEFERLLTAIGTEARTHMQAGPLIGGGYAWWCHTCRTGQSAMTHLDALDQHSVGVGGLAHLLGADHAARKVLIEDTP